jgi:hypothetical protein
MTRAELDILLSKYLEQARDGDFLVVDCGPCFAQSRLSDGAVAVEVRGNPCPPDLLRRVDALFADYRAEGGGTSESEPGCLAVTFPPGDSRIAEAMTRALDSIYEATAKPPTLSSGEGPFMPRRKGFLGLGGYGPIA